MNDVSGLALFQEILSEKRRLVDNKLILDKKANYEYPITEVPFQIPTNWHWCYLSDISLIQEGPGIRKHQYRDEGIQFLTVTNILEDSIDLEKSKKYISLDEYEKSYKHFSINKGDIVTACSGGSWGKSAIYDLDDKIILNTSTLRLRFYNDLGVNKYLYYLTKTSYFKRSLSIHTTGQQPNYGYFHYSRIPIPLPPLSEQKRIVAILDEAFEAISKAKANAEKNLKNSKELFESYLQSVFANKCDDWEEKTLGNIAYVKSGGTPLCSNKAYWNGGTIPWYSSGELNNLYTKNPERYITQLGLDSSNAKLFPKGSLLIGMYDTAALKMSIIDRDATFNQAIAGVKPNEKLNLLFIFHAINAIRSDLLNLRRGVRQKNLSLEKIKNISLPIPALSIQKSIASRLDTLSAETKRLEVVYQKKLGSLEELKKSILQKAFAGEL